MLNIQHMSFNFPIAATQALALLEPFGIHEIDSETLYQFVEQIQLILKKDGKECIFVSSKREYEIFRSYYCNYFEILEQDNHFTIAPAKGRTNPLTNKTYDMTVEVLVELFYPFTDPDILKACKDESVINIIKTKQKQIKK